MADAAPRSRGHLNPGDGDVVFDRFALGPPFAELVRHVWVVRWSVAAGQERVQRVLSYPAVNVVFEPSGVAVYGPDSRVSERVLADESWAVGVLFRPAAAVALTSTSPRELVRLGPHGERLDAAPTLTIARVMEEQSRSGSEAASSSPSSLRLSDAARSAVIDVLRDWLWPRLDRIDAPGRLLNRVCALAEEDANITRVADLADAVGVNRRQLERLVADRLGVTPKWLIECRRLQNAATELFSGAVGDLSELAVQLGYADYAHFSRRYKAVLDETPEQTRRAGAEARQ